MRARDEMSEVIARNSNALRTVGDEGAKTANKLLGAGVVISSMGRMFSNVGGAIVDLGRQGHEAAVDFESASALIATQAQDLGLSVEQISELTKELARAQPVSIPGLQESLFDIFSTFEGTEAEVKRIQEAASILGVASAEDVSSFGGALAGVLNAFDLGSRDAMDVADLWFRMAEKGQITLGEFASVIGTAVSPALAFGQSLDTTSASIAFLTKETDLSASQASTATARLFDMLRKNTGDLQEAGIVVTDQAGNYLPLIDVIDQLADATRDMSDIEQAEFLESIFGGGEIRAMRALIPLIEDTETLKLVMGEANATVEDSDGLMDAYAIQMGTTAVKLQELQNRFDLLKIEIGEALIPVFESLISVVERLLGWWESLDEETRQLIIQFTFFVGVILAVVGPILTVVGGIVIAIGVFQTLGITMGFVAGVALGTVVAIAALIAIGVLLWQNWDTVKAKAEELWGKLQEFWGWLSTTLGPGFQIIAFEIKKAWNEIAPEIIQTLESIKTKIQAALDFIGGLWERHGTTISNAVRSAWIFISTLIGGVIRIISNIIQLGLNLIQGDWAGAWENIKTIGRTASTILNVMIMGLVARIVGWFGQLPGKVLRALAALPGMLLRFGIKIMTSLLSGITNKWSSSVFPWFTSRKFSITGVFASAGNWLRNAGSRILGGLLGGMKSKWNSVSSWVGGLGGKIRRLKGPEDVDKRLLIGAGNLIMEGLEFGLQRGWKDVERFLSSLDIQKTASIDLRPTPMSPFSGMSDAIMMAMQEQKRSGLNVEGDLVIGSADDVPELDFWAQKRMAGV